jgi:hypothetical protein
MMKRRSFLAIAAFGLLASLTFTAPSHAGSVDPAYAVVSNVTVLAGSATDITEYFNLPGLAYVGPMITNIPGGVTLVPILATDTSITFNVNGPSPDLGPGTYTLDYIITGPAGLKFLGGSLSGAGAQGGAVGIVGSVPEPTSMALLGIGMTSFLAFRRFFKRTPVA